MATALTFKKIVSSTISSGSSFIVNEGGNKATAEAILVFEKPSSEMNISAYYPSISSVKVGGQNWFTEKINIKFTAGRYSDTGGWATVYGTAFSDKTNQVSESSGTTSTSCSMTGGSSSISGTWYPAYKIVVSHVNDTIGCKVVMSGFELSVDYTVPHTHSYTTETSRTASTCCTQGSVTKKCSCGETQTTELALDPNNHSGGTEVKNASSATCTTTGYTGDTYCKGCGAKLSSGSTIAALGHNYTSSVVAPTVTESGYTLHTCSRCGHSYKDNYTALITVNCDTEMGTVEGGGIYNHGDTASLFATANEGYEFVQWSDGVEYDLRSITVTGSATYTAIFEKIPPPEITSVQMLYSNKQISAANKVPAGEFFRIVVGAVAYDI